MTNKVDPDTISESTKLDVWSPMVWTGNQLYKVSYVGPSVNDQHTLSIEFSGRKFYVITDDFGFSIENKTSSKLKRIVNIPKDYYLFYKIAGGDDTGWAMHSNFPVSKEAADDYVGGCDRRKAVRF